VALQPAETRSFNQAGQQDWHRRPAHPRKLRRERSVGPRSTASSAFRTFQHRRKGLLLPPKCPALFQKEIPRWFLWIPQHPDANLVHTRRPGTRARIFWDSTSRDIEPSGHDRERLGQRYQCPGQIADRWSKGNAEMDRKSRGECQLIHSCLLDHLGNWTSSSVMWLQVKHVLPRCASNGSTGFGNLPKPRCPA